MSDKIQKIHIKSIGSSGDGVGKDENGKSWYIPATFTDETIEAKYIAPRGKGIAGQAINIENQSPNRQTEPCKHIKNCGGCSLQHMKDDFYKQWQLETVKNILSQNGLENIGVKNIFQADRNTRRRANFHISHEDDGVKVGFYNSFSQKVERIEGCLVLADKLKNYIPQLEELFSKILKKRKKAEASVTLCKNGLDILLKFPKKLKKSQLEVLQSYSDKGIWARLAIQEPEMDPYILWQTQEPFVNFGKTSVPVAVGGFLQATDGGEKAILEAVTAEVADSKNILELFAGNGTITLPLLEQNKKVTAVEIDNSSLRMLRQGAKEYTQQLSIVEKDLFKENYSTDELNNFDCIVLDPPRAGAKRVIIAISRTNVPKVVMVSCNIKTFAQDAKILVDAGYKLNEVSIIDQFLWTPHVEVIGSFKK